MKEIHDSRGRVIATIFDGAPIVNVNDARGRNIGFSTPNGTFDARGNLVSTDPWQYGLSSSHATKTSTKPTEAEVGNP